MKAGDEFEDSEDLSDNHHETKIDSGLDISLTMSDDFTIPNSSANSNTAPVGFESSVLKWIKEEKMQIDNDISFSEDEFGDYNILMYETQDAFRHCCKLRMKLLACEEKLREKNKTIEELQKENLVLRKEHKIPEIEEKILLLQRKLQEAEYGLGFSEISKDKDETQRKTLASICQKYTDKCNNHPSSEEVLIRRNRHVQWDKLNNTEANQESETNDQTLLENHTDDNDNDNSFSRSITDDILESTDEKPKVTIEQSTVTESSATFEKSTSTDLEEQHDEKKTFSPEEVEVLNKQMKTISALAKRNDITVQFLVTKCHELTKQNARTLRKLYNDNMITSKKLEKWMECYMILKRQHEVNTDIYQQELKKAWNVEKEYKIQIKNLCEMISRLSTEANAERKQIEDYRKTYETIIINLHELDQQFDMISELTTDKVLLTETKLKELVLKCERLQNSPASKKKRNSRRLSKNIFRLKRRISESNESLNS